MHENNYNKLKLFQGYELWMHLLNITLCLVDPSRYFKKIYGYLVKFWFDL
jgi:hypothetical protein